MDTKMKTSSSKASLSGIQTQRQPHTGSFVSQTAKTPSGNNKWQS